MEYEWKNAREDDGGDILVAELVVFVLGAAKDAIRKPPPGCDCHRSEEGLARDITDGEDVRNTGRLIFVDDDSAMLTELDANFLQAHVLRVRFTPDRPQQVIDGVGLTLVGMDRDGLSDLRTFDLGDLSRLVNLHASMLRPVGDDILDHGVKGAQDTFMTEEHVRLGTESIEHTSELEGDVASADDGDALWPILELEETIRCDAQAGAGNLVIRRDSRLAPSGNSNIVCVKLVGGTVGCGDLDGVCILELAPARMVFDAVTVKITSVDASKVLHIFVPTGLECLPVKLRGNVLVVVRAGVFHTLAQIGGVPHNLDQEFSIIEGLQGFQ